MTKAEHHIKNQCIEDIQRLLNREKSSRDKIKNKDKLPRKDEDIAKLFDIHKMSDEDLQEYKKAVEESFARILTIETGLRSKLIQMDKELMKRQESA